MLTRVLIRDRRRAGLTGHPVDSTDPASPRLHPRRRIHPVPTTSPSPARSTAAACPVTTPARARSSQLADLGAEHRDRIDDLQVSRDSTLGIILTRRRPPHTAITASPMNFSIVRRSARRSCAPPRNNDPGAPALLLLTCLRQRREPTRSTNRTDTNRSSARAGAGFGGVATGPRPPRARVRERSPAFVAEPLARSYAEPHCGQHDNGGTHSRQNFAPSLFSASHAEHFTTTPSCLKHRQD